MQLKAGETGGVRAPSLGTFLPHARSRNPRFGTCSSQNSFFTCETPTPAAVLLLRQNKSPITTPGLTTLNLGVVVSAVYCMYLPLSYHVLVCRRILGKLQMGVGSWSWLVVIDTSEHSSREREDTCEQSEAEQHTTMYYVSRFSAHLH